MAVSKRTRYEVLRRDNFTCRYCRSTDNPLTVDHVQPVALGGTDDPANLVTACRDCNAGKSSTGPDEGTVAEVTDDAVRWAAAMKQAGVELATARERDRTRLATFREKYHLWLPRDWEPTVLNWIDGSGLTLEDATDCMEIALGREYIPHEDVFSYACGIARNKIRVIQERAHQIFTEAGGA